LTGLFTWGNEEAIMKDNLGFCRNSLRVGAALLGAVALVIALGVIPAVRSDTFPAATPDRAVPAFWVTVGINLMVAMVLLVVARRKKGRTRTLASVLGLLAFFALMLAFALFDAASALRSHGPGMRPVSVLLFACSAADLMTALLVMLTAFLFPRRG
jgi:hypothetical protein